jgi:hypothetical protein
MHNQDEHSGERIAASVAGVKMTLTNPELLPPVKLRPMNLGLMSFLYSALNNRHCFLGAFMSLCDAQKQRRRTE